MNIIRKYAKLKSLLEDERYKGWMLIESDNRDNYNIYPERGGSLKTKLKSCVEPILDYLIERVEKKINKEFKNKFERISSVFIGEIESSDIEIIQAKMSISGNHKEISTNIRLDYEFSLETDQSVSTIMLDQKLLNLLKGNQFEILQNHISLGEYTWTEDQDNKEDLDISVKEIFNYSKKRISKQRERVEEVANCFVTDDINVSIPIKPKFYLINVLDPGNGTFPYLAHYNEWVLEFSFNNLI